MKKDGELWRRSRLRQVKYLNNIVKQDQPAHYYCGQECGLSEGSHRDEEGWRALASITAAAGEIFEQHRRARSPAGETINRPGTWLWWLLDGPTNAGRLRGNGDDQERAGSEHRRQRHQGPGRVHRRTVPAGRLRRHLTFSQTSHGPTLHFATEPLQRGSQHVKERRRSVAIYADPDEGGPTALKASSGQFNGADSTWQKSGGPLCQTNRPVRRMLSTSLPN